jgi:glycosyltransferase involved in cell wall biosynthesis
MDGGRRNVHVVVPEGIDDPDRPSGGNVYDRRVVNALAGLGWSVQEHPLAGPWPDAGVASSHALRGALETIADGETVLVDGLVGCAAPMVVSRQARRLRIVVLVHLPLGVQTLSRRSAEGALLGRVAGVVATSNWTRSWLVEHYGLDPTRVAVAVPGTEVAAAVPVRPAGDRLLCVGAVTPTKGHDLLLDALACIGDLAWSCRCVGSTDVEPRFAAAIRERAVRTGLASRVELTGPRTGDDLAAAYDAADVLVLPSRAETYGMVVTEALARGLPVIASRVGGVPEALGRTADDCVPGVLVPPGDPDALAAALRSWLLDPALRARKRDAARARRQTLPTWTQTAAAVAAVLEGR